MHSATRRQFVTSLGIAAAGAATLRWTNILAAAQKSNLKLGIQLYSLRGYKDASVALKHAKELGFEQVEFYSGMFPLDASAEKIAAIKKEVAGLGLKISAHGVNALTKDDKANRKVFEFAKAVGLPTITVDPTADSFDSVEALVKEFNIRVAIHNHGPSHHYNKVVDVLKAIENRDSRIGACADLGHFIRSGENPVQVVRLLAGRLYGVHLKDFAEMQDKTKGVILGKGHLNVATVFDALVETKFPSDGALSLEYEENPENPLEDIRQCVKVARDALKQVG